MIVQILLTLLTGTGLSLIIFSVIPFPSIREKSLIKKHGKSKRHVDFEKAIITPTALKLSKHLKLNSYDKAQLERKLKNADMDMTAEYYISRAITLTAFILLLAALFTMVHIYLLTAFLVVSAVITYYKVKNEVDDKLKSQRTAINIELPQFMLTIIQTLLYSRDLQDMIDKYRLVAGPELRYKLDLLMFNMKTGNHEQALSDFAESIGIDYLTTFVNGLISQSRGISQRDFLISVEKDMKVKTIERLKIKGNKKPGKLRIAQFLLFSSSALIWLAAIGLSAFSGVKILYNF